MSNQQDRVQPQRLERKYLVEERDRIQPQRFEMKYLVEERVALGIRDWVRSYLDVDEHGATHADLSYPVHSIYLDSPDLMLYRSTVNGDKNRFKLRLRFYENRPGAPVFLEIKSRMNNCISKQRSRVRAEAVDSLLAGYLPEPSHLVSQEPKQLMALERFCKLVNELRAQPRTHVAYLREAWISREDNSVRVTLDRQVCTETDPVARLVPEMTNPVLVFGDQVILELKFTGRFPDWFKELVRVFELMQCGAAKYADGVTRLGAQTVSHTFSLDNFNPTAQERLRRIDRAAAAPQRNGQADGMAAILARRFS